VMMMMMMMMMMIRFLEIRFATTCMCISLVTLMRKKSFEARLMELHCRFLGSLVTIIIIIININLLTHRQTKKYCSCN